MISNIGYKGLLLGLLLSIPALLSGQSFGNEWIDHSQQYLRLKVGATGVHKLSYQEIAQAGFPVDQINPRTLQLFHRGKEQAILVEGESDGVMNADDFVLFWGKKNDGVLDQELYLEPGLQPHKLHNLYSDTTAYYLTFSLSGAGGKRMVSFSQTNEGNLAPEPFYWDERLFLYTHSFSQGTVYGFAGGSLDTYLSYGDEGEGWFGDVIAGRVQSFTITDLSDAYTAGPVPQLKMQLVGRNSLQRNTPVQAGASSAALSLVHTASFTGYKTYTVQDNLSWSSVANNQTVIGVGASGSERVSVTYLQYRYPRLWNMANVSERSFRLPASSSSRYIEVQNVPAGLSLYDVTNPDQVIRIAFRLEGNVLKAMLPPSNTEQVLQLSGSQKSVRLSKPLSFRKLPATADYVIISHRELMKPAGGYNDPVQAYAAYRNSAAGGSYDTLVVEMQELYDQFSYGEYSPVAIRRFVQYISQQKLPRYLFLIGKALELNHAYYRRSPWTDINKDLVPTFGWPGADIPFVAQLKGSGFAPAFPIGRHSARTPTEVAVYLKKVIEDETLTPKGLWLKRLVHLGGGNNASEGQQLRNYLRRYEYIAEAPHLGASVTSITKNTAAVVQEVDLSKEINAGARLITFFGHSGTLTTDVEIGLATDPKSGYHNKGYYPRFIINGCGAGNVFGTGGNWVDDWMYAADKGALNFIAHVSNGYTTLLYQYSLHFYQVAASDENFLGATIGTVQQEAVRRLLANSTATPLMITQAQQMLLQGDPALQLFDIKKSDFEANNNSLSVRALHDKPLNMTADSISIAVVVKNFGRAVEDSLEVQLEYWRDQNEPKMLEFFKAAPVFYQDTLYIKLATSQLDGPGISNFKVTLNPQEAIAESDYNNNSGTLQVLIPAGGTLNLHPYNYALVKHDQQKLIVQGIDFLQPSRGFEVMLDTANTYNSPSLQATQIEAAGLLSWEPPLPEIKAAAADTLVYYWKSRLTTPSPTEDATFSKSSFTYIKDAPLGWAQAHEGQFSENKLSSLEVSANRSWSFVPLERVVKVTTWGSETPGMDYRDVEVAIDGVQQNLKQAYRTCVNNTINAISFDKNSLANPMAKIPSIIRPQSCGRIPVIINSFNGGDVIYGNNDAYNLTGYLNEMPAGNWVLLFTVGWNGYSQWPDAVKEQLLSLGVDPLRLGELMDGEPLVVLGKKGGAPGSALVIMADRTAGSPPAKQQVIQMESSVKGTPGIGLVESSLIGPVTSWQDLAVVIKAGENDYWKMDVLGVNAQLQETALLQLRESGTVPLQLSAAEYPYLRLRMQLVDTVNLTPPQLKFWRVGFEPLPEGVLLSSDTLQAHYKISEGKSMQAGFKFVNISEKAFAADSLQVFASQLNQNSRSTIEKNIKIKAPAPGDTVLFAVPLQTLQQVGINDLQVKVNPVPGSEFTLTNNVRERQNFMRVLADSLHPFIDVAFDGAYITNGEIIRPQPLISVIMRDENKIMLKQDTTGVHLYLKKECDGCTPVRVSLSNPTVRIFPATSQEDFRIEFTPESPLEDGLYTLQVQAQDGTGNKAGTRPYAVSFEVVSESSITNFYPYPNPFSTSTRFVFTLTGSEVPQDLKIQIMTVSGKVVREILKEELGLKIGQNISQYAWDGTDEWGQRLANGVYLYRVVIGGSNASEWKHRQTKGDKAFKQQFGKLYILR